MERFPTVAGAGGRDARGRLREWQGLGYDRRALALWRAARIVVDEHGGRVPSTVTELEATARCRPVHRSRRGGDRVRCAGRAPSTSTFAASSAASSPAMPRRLSARGAPGTWPTRSVPDDRPGDVDARPDGHRGDAVPATSTTLRRMPGPAVVPLRAAATGRGASGTPRPRATRRRARSARPSHSPRPIAGSAAGSSIACARHRTANGSRSTRRSAPTTETRVRARGRGDGRRWRPGARPASSGRDAGLTARLPLA